MLYHILILFYSIQVQSTKLAVIKLSAKITNFKKYSPLLHTFMLFLDNFERVPNSRKDDILFNKPKTAENRWPTNSTPMLYAITVSELRSQAN